jgi:catechol 2,3-dioxygenase-like lactoylglutathione lyase family enzyme
MRPALLACVVAIALAACRSDDPGPLARAARAAHGSEMSHPIPIFSVRDLAASRRYYRDALGFELKWQTGDFGAVQRGDATLFMCERCQGNPGTWIMIFTPDVDKLHAELLRRKALVKMPPSDMPWNLREMHVSDPDGNVIRFGSELEH